MKIALINGSPKASGSSSALLLQDIKKRLGSSEQVDEFILNKAQVNPATVEAIAQYDVLLFAFPLYVDSLPSHLLRWLVALEAHYQAAGTIAGNPAGTMVYALVNCGFYEAAQNSLAIEIMHNWSQRCQLIWGQGAGIGGGGMVSLLSRIPAGRGPLKNLGAVLEALTANLLQRMMGDPLFADPNFPRAAYQFFAHQGWKAAGKANGLQTKDLSRRL